MQCHQRPSCTLLVNIDRAAATNVVVSAADIGGRHISTLLLGLAVSGYVIYLCHNIAPQLCA